MSDKELALYKIKFTFARESNKNKCRQKHRHSILYIMFIMRLEYPPAIGTFSGSFEIENSLRTLLKTELKPDYLPPFLLGVPKNNDSVLGFKFLDGGLDNSHSDIPEV